MKATNPVRMSTPVRASGTAKVKTHVKASTPPKSGKPSNNTWFVQSSKTGKASTGAKGTKPVHASTSAKSTTVVKPNSKAKPNSAMRSAVPIAQDCADEEGARADKDMTVLRTNVKGKLRAVEERGLKAFHAHAEKKPRCSKKVVDKSDSNCDDKELMHHFADFPAEGGRNKDFRLSDAGAEEIDSSIEHVSSAARAAESVMKHSTLPVRSVFPKGSGKGSAVKGRSAPAKKSAAKSHEVNSSGRRTGK